MQHAPAIRDATIPHRVEPNLREVGQLFNTMDQSPFHERDLDRDAEEFILSWVREFPLTEPVVLVVHLSEFSRGPEPQPLVEEADWWPLRRRGRIYEKLSQLRVEVRKRQG